MTHPNDEQLTGFLYDELDPPRHAELARHLDSCARCRGQIDAWRSVRSELRAWQLPALTASRAAAAASARGARGGALRWAVAAAVLLASGFALAHLTTTRAVDLARLRAELVREVRQEVRQDLAIKLARHAADESAQQRAFREAVVQAMDRLEARQVVDHTSLRTDMETVALRTEQEFARLISMESGGEPPQ